MCCDMLLPLRLCANCFCKLRAVSPCRRRKAARLYSRASGICNSQGDRFEVSCLAVIVGPIFLSARFGELKAEEDIKRENYTQTLQQKR